MNRVYVVINIVTSHQSLSADRVFANPDAAEKYCSRQIDEHYTGIRESEHTEQIGDFLWSNGVDDWGYEIQFAEFVDGDSR